MYISNWNIYKLHVCNKYKNLMLCNGLHSQWVFFEVQSGRPNDLMVYGYKFTPRFIKWWPNSNSRCYHWVGIVPLGIPCGVDKTKKKQQPLVTNTNWAFTGLKGHSVLCNKFSWAQKLRNKFNFNIVLCISQMNKF
jgi:hypothetical protein